MQAEGATRCTRPEKVWREANKADENKASMQKKSMSKAWATSGQLNVEFGGLSQEMHWKVLYSVLLRRMKEPSIYFQAQHVASWPGWTKKVPAEVLSLKMFQSPGLAIWHLSSMNMMGTAGRKPDHTDKEQWAAEWDRWLECRIQPHLLDVPVRKNKAKFCQLVY